MSRNRILKVYYNDLTVGSLAETADGRVAFEYDELWVSEGFPISPFSLPLRKEVFVPGRDCPDGMFGVFRDSLPDAWGRLLVDRVLRKSGVNPSDISMLDRLAIVGHSGMGALIYVPEWNIASEYEIGTLDEVAAACRSIFLNEETDYIDALYSMGGSSGGARPKILVSDHDGDWIIKFPSSYDSGEIGEQEYEYSVAARKCGITMPETRLFESEKCSGYFGIKRFDRELWADGSVKRKHMITAEGLLETDHRLPNLDYADLMKLCKILTFSDKEELLQMYRRMCFNVFAHNRDDHSKNFSYVYNDDREKYEMSPAYDLTYSTTYYGEHTTTVAGEGANPGMDELIKVGTEAGLGKSLCTETAKEIRSIAEPLAAKWSGRR
ncbi:MAG: type II toxin-antitoxin system HipA family toxin [Mogibacterium sp.]|nr:type II toxin-antitoxin system HipA family toxin [Mogibacterium sp.]